MNSTGERKKRSDKKRDIKPSISLELYEVISGLSYIVGKSIKDVGVSFCNEGINNQEVINYLARYFKRDYWFHSSMYPGISNNNHFQFTGNKKRIMLRFNQKDHEQINYLAFSMNQSVSSATGLLLFSSVNNTNLIEQYISKHKNNLDRNRYNYLKEIFNYATKNNLYKTSVTLPGFFQTKIKSIINKWT